MIDRIGKLHASFLPAEGVPAPGEIVAGKYVVEGLLGVGGMGVVVAARHRALGTPVAIKLVISVDDQFHAEAKVRLIREARAAAALGGDSVVRIYDVDEDASGRPFIVMERLEGADLGDVLQFRGTLSVGEATALVAQACGAVAEAHRAGIVHRDLKPSNLFVIRKPDGTAQVKVLDFGIAKSLRAEELGQQTLTGTRTALGSPAYMSPEQVRDARKVDARTDVWSLGLILYELLTGKVAFSASTLPGVCAAIVADTPAAPSLLLPTIPAELDAVVLACLEKDREKRIPSADALRARLARFEVETLEFSRLLPVSALPHTLAIPGSPEEVPPLTEDAPALPSELPPSPRPDSGAVSGERTLESAVPVPAEPAHRHPATPPESGAAPWTDGRRARKLALFLLLTLGGAAALVGIWRANRSEVPTRSASPLVSTAPAEAAHSAPRASGFTGVSSAVVQQRAIPAARPSVLAAKRLRTVRPPAPSASVGPVEIRMSR